MTQSDHLNSGADIELKPGMILLNDYRVEGIIGSGGMGKVYKITRQTGKKETFALKMLHKKSFAHSRGRRAFLRELRTWLDLPDYPHIAGCRFFRSVEDRLAIFSEYVEGGSLADHLQHDTEFSDAEKIDIAIQVGWGLKASHLCGVIHQDIKPANILISTDGIAKITDFGIARATERGGIQAYVSSKKKSCVVTSGGMTVAYCSPEQASGQKVGFNTDIWSWGLTIFEMFTGKMFWQLGCMAQTILDTYLSGESSVEYRPMPRGLIDFLRRCFEIKPSERWENLDDAVNDLKTIYRKMTGNMYVRPQPDIPDVSGYNESEHEPMTVRSTILDDPLELYRQLLEKKGKPSDFLEKWQELRKGSRKNIALINLEIFDRLLGTFKMFFPEETVENLLIHSRILHQIGLLLEYLHDYSGALSRFNRAIEILKTVICNEDEMKVYLLFNQNYNEKAHTLYALRNIKGAIETLKHPIEMTEKKIRSVEDIKLEKSLSILYLNQAVWMAKSGHEKDALSVFNRVIEIREKQLKSEYTASNLIGLANIYENKATLMSKIGRNIESLEFHDKAIDLWLNHGSHFERRTYVENLCQIYINKAVVLWQEKRFEDCRKNLDRVISILNEHIEKYGFSDFRQRLVMTYSNKSVLLLSMNKLNIARETAEKAVEICEELVYGEGRMDLLENLADCYGNLAGILDEMDNNIESVDIHLKTIDILEKLYDQSSSLNAKDHLAVINLTISSLYRRMDQPDQAGKHALKSVELFDSLVNQDKKIHRQSSLGAALSEVAYYQRHCGEEDKAVLTIQKALPLLKKSLDENESDRIKLLLTDIERDFNV